MNGVNGNGNGNHNADLDSLGLNSHSDDESSSGSDSDGDGEGEGDQRRAHNVDLIISNALAKGLSVNVNGSSWQRVLIRIDDKADEAVIIIYGLMPGRQYDIDLGLVNGAGGGSGGTGNLRRQVITEGMCIMIFNR